MRPKPPSKARADMLSINETPSFKAPSSQVSHEDQLRFLRTLLSDRSRAWEGEKTGIRRALCELLHPWSGVCDSSWHKMGGMEGSGAKAGQIATSVAILAAYLTLNSSLNLLNR